MKITTELVELDSEGQEMEFIAEGNMEDMEEARDEILRDSEMAGADWPNLVIQPATAGR